MTELLSSTSYRLALLLGAALTACASETPRSTSPYDDPSVPLPERLSDLGLAPGQIRPERLRAYAPSWPLWSSGSTKQRLAFIPAPIDTVVPGAWQFPPGAMWFKTFAYADRNIETRVLRRTTRAWEYAVYLWSDDGDDASLLDLDRATLVPVIDEQGNAFDHRVPNRLDCRMCHESAPEPVLGFSELQLDDREVAALADDGLLTVAITSPVNVDHEDPQTKQVLGMFQGNCTHCHNGGAGPSSSFDLRYTAAVANTVNHPTESSASAAGIRIVPGAPDESILFLAVSGETTNPAIKAMPPLGVDRRDSASIEALRDWITQLR